MNSPRMGIGLVTVLLGILPMTLHGQYSAYPPPPGTLLVTPSYLFTTFDNSWFGSVSGSHPTVEQHTALFNAEYGLAEDWWVDVSLGYVHSKADTLFGAMTLEGLADTRLGARYRAFDDETTYLWFLPTVTFRAGAIIQGTYNTAPILPLPMLPGNGASGGEFAMLLGKQFGESGWGLYSDIGGRVFADGVPAQLTASFGAYGTFFEKLTMGVGWRHLDSFSGPDLTTPGLLPSQLREVRENWHRVEGTLTFADERGLQYQVYAGYVFAGRNTGEEFAGGLSVTVPFKLRKSANATPQP